MFSLKQNDRKEWEIFIWKKPHSICCLVVYRFSDFFRTRLPHSILFLFLLGEKLFFVIPFPPLNNSKSWPLLIFLALISAFPLILALIFLVSSGAPSPAETFSLFLSPSFEGKKKTQFFQQKKLFCFQKKCQLRPEPQQGDASIHWQPVGKWTRRQFQFTNFLFSSFLAAAYWRLYWLPECSTFLAATSRTPFWHPRCCKLLVLSTGKRCSCFYHWLIFIFLLSPLIPFLCFWWPQTPDKQNNNSKCRIFYIQPP